MGRARDSACVCVVRGRESQAVRGLSKMVVWAMGAEGEGRIPLASKIRQDVEPAQASLPWEQELVPMQLDGWGPRCG